MPIRNYVEGDWAAVCEIYDLAKPHELSGVVDASEIPPLAQDTAALDLFRTSNIVVLEAAHRIVAFAGHRDSVITWLFVHPSYRRRGFALDLLRHLLAILPLPIKLNVAATNVAARALYERLGFQLEREFDGMFKEHPCRVCRLRLDA